MKKFKKIVLFFCSLLLWALVLLVGLVYAYGAYLKMQPYPPEPYQFRPVTISYGNSEETNKEAALREAKRELQQCANQLNTTIKGFQGPYFYSVRDDYYTYFTIGYRSSQGHLIYTQLYQDKDCYPMSFKGNCHGYKNCEWLQRQEAR